ncbi:hypothetical protein NW766_007839 [Fusarium irregulare]|uniref:Uncharacterized protein n=1 Tax=Fusarium irregulare TaxID=2494466 RepID=A0A9W8PN66_9HYPO|nr:hypothetical protein NW766_007839 [Fusarium irregulare]
MGAIRFDVHDILSLGDLNDSDGDYFQNNGYRRRSVRPGPAVIIKLAERGHWIQIRKQDIDDKSKADTIQKTLKPLNIQEAMIIQTQDFKGDFAAMLQRHFYSEISHKMALFSPKEEHDAIAPTDADGLSMQWIEPLPGSRLREGDVLPSGLALSRLRVTEYGGSPIYYLDTWGGFTDASIQLEQEFLARWEAILSTFLFEDREKLAEESNTITMENIGRQNAPQDNSSYRKVLFLPLLEELKPKLANNWETLFWEGKSILHLESLDEIGWEMLDDRPWKEKSMSKPNSWRFVLLATVLSGLYGGVHLTIWGQAFPYTRKRLCGRLVACSSFAASLPL